MSAVTVIGIGADGWPGVTAALRQRVLDAEVVLGGTRHLEMLPDAPGQVREAWPSPLREGLPALLWKYDGRRVVALASGDPFVSGIGGTLVDLLGRSAVVVEPAVSSVALARARMGWDDATVEVVSTVGRDAHAVLRALAPGHRLVVLSSDAGTPTQVAGLLVVAGYGSSKMTVLGDLGSRDETHLASTAAEWGGQAPQLNVIALELVGPVVGGWSAGLPDNAFEHDGQLTKRDLRASALARLAPTPGAVLWDVGAGAGSVGIEWMRAHPTCRTIAIEGNVERAARITRNALALGVPALEVVQGRAPEALHGLPTPDAIFVGGGATATGVIENCLAALGSGGRLVVHGVTLETEVVLANAHQKHGGELTRHQIETAAPIGTFTGWSPARTVTQWALVKEQS
ncbi:bifunctional cobalt-precorrin-7 (C(5))-methyltransferase/cobalt-precorrin-6B (C(15))-methyltransferase [Nocardioides jensenii]|uniref:bifunctional cobalt-precorrin-7 (C(5))-methyltransferase/cobalt-precorrin-6B (C(15))-methyltransferase n=1 Tax=Nocardioides jensenii TaxID=1843 RepID=UPI0008321EC2|nr:bifunctional cobalt-precorrin-7 (C(5))-methyltransferase/cobalt-precorrin-6B (C(15))-methyltransferase [Nocardioides jensenii]